MSGQTRHPLTAVYPTPAPVALCVARDDGCVPVAMTIKPLLIGDEGGERIGFEMPEGSRVQYHLEALINE